MSNDNVLEMNFKLKIKSDLYLLKASFKWSSDKFLDIFGFDVKLHLNPHFLTISRSTATLFMTLVGSKYE